QPLQRDRHGPADRSRDQELDPLGRVHEPIEGARHGDARCGDRGGTHPAAADSHDVRGDDHGRDPGDDRTRRGLHLAPAARLRDRGRHLLFDGADIVRRARWVRAAGPPDGARTEPRPRGTTGGGRLMLALLALLQLQAATLAPSPDDSLPTVTLAEALRRATGLDPNYVAALGQVDNAVWARRSAFSVFILPSVTVSAAGSRLNPAGFNVLTGSGLLPTQVTAQLNARYDLFLGGQKLAELSRSGAALEAAHAGELVARFAAAQLTESDYYAVLADAELLRVARERVQRAEQQLGVARARVVSGAAVQTDSLQLRLELTKARVVRLLQESALRIARLELGRRVGATGPMDAAPLDTTPAPDLPITLAGAINEGGTQGPQYRVARANERAAGAA